MPMAGSMAVQMSSSLPFHDASAPPSELASTTVQMRKKPAMQARMPTENMVISSYLRVRRTDSVERMGRGRMRRAMSRVEETALAAISMPKMLALQVPVALGWKRVQK